MAGGLVTVMNTIIAGNSANAGTNGVGAHGTAYGPDVYGPSGVSSPGFNLIGTTNDSSGWVATDIKGSTASRMDPLLNALTSTNGGPTPTMSLKSSSAAIDGGKSFGVTSDQRGLRRPTDLPGYPNAPGGGDGTDIGAFEMMPTSGTAPSISVQPASQFVETGGSATFTVVAGGSEPLSYQWQCNSNAIAGATNSTFTTNSASSAGYFNVVVINSVGVGDQFRGHVGANHFACRSVRAARKLGHLRGDGLRGRGVRLPVVSQRHEPPGQRRCGGFAHA